MSTHPVYDTYNTQPQSQWQQDESKAPYDDLIDEYSAPYAANDRHQTHTLQTSSDNGLRRGLSLPFGQKNSTSTKHSNDTSVDLISSHYPPQPQQESEAPGLWQRILPESLACRLFVLTVLIETTIDLAIEGELLLRVRNETHDDDTVTSRSLPVYLSIFALAHVFQFVMAVDAVYARNTIQFISLTIFNALFLGYAIIQIKEIRDAVSGATTGVSKVPIDVLTTIIPIVISIAEVAYIALGWKIYHEFGWKVYKFLGADRRIKQMYANYQIYECLVKWDTFFWVGFSVQFIWLVLQNNDWEYYVTCAALPLSIILLIEGHLAARHENKWMMATFMSGCVGAMVYFIYKLIKVLVLRQTDEFKFVWKSLTVFSVLAIVLLFATFVFSIIVMRNFARGLRDALTRKKLTQHTKFGSQSFNRLAAGQNQQRMSIT